MRFIYLLLFPPPGSLFLADLSEKQVFNLVWPYVAKSVHVATGKQETAKEAQVCNKFMKICTVEYK